jgi:hypothetical protein
MRSRHRAAAVLACLAFAVAGFSADGSVQLSDGRVERGQVTLAQALQVHDGKTLRTVPIEQVREVLIEPESEAMERQWRFVEAGSTKKEFSGEPYPVRHLVATVVCVGGERVRGHLTTTIAWLVTEEKPDERERVMLPAKQQGKPGETLASLVYPVRVVPTPAEGAAAAPSLLRLRGAPAQAEIVAVTRGALARMETAPAADGAYALAAPVEPPAFVAARVGDAVTVSWPADGDATVAKLAAQAVTDAQDFMDSRRLLGVWAEGDDQVYGLLQLYRAGGEVDDPGKKPWRLEIWRWRREGERLLWAGRAYFYRGLAANEGALPRVERSQAWWTQSAKDGTWVVGEEDTHGR